jgi:uncharacterized protein (UPF0276 family)
MKLAVNFSEALVSLLEEDPALPVDYIKAPTIPFPGCWSQFETGGKYRRLLPHPAQQGVLALGHPQPELRFNREVVAEVIDRTDPPYISTHLEARVEFFPEFRDFQHELDPVVEEALFRHFLSAVRQVKAEIGLPLVLENFPYYSFWVHYKLCADPGFITRICTEGDCGFLLDIAHARCSAWFFQMDLLSYLSALPLDRTKEIHLAGVQTRAEGMIDTHTKLEEDDYVVLNRVLARTDPEIVTIEYGGMPDQIMNLQGEYEPVLRNDPRELAEMIYRVKQACA